MFKWFAVFAAIFVLMVPVRTHTTIVRQTIVKHTQPKVIVIHQTERKVIYKTASIQDSHASKWMDFTATWYSNQQGSGNNHVTASGATTTSKWTIATDPRIIPTGSLVEIRFRNGKTRIAKAEDVGGAIKGRHIDIYNSNNTYDIQQGIKHVKLRILTKG